MVVDAFLPLDTDADAYAATLAAQMGRRFIRRYVIAQLLRLEFADGATLTVTANSLNVRTGPGMGYPVLATLAKDEPVTELERTTDAHGTQWVRHDKGWSSAAYLKGV